MPLSIYLNISTYISAVCTKYNILFKHSPKIVYEASEFDCQGTASAKEFYKRHHKWTEGLLSAAKSVGWGASILV